MTSKQTNQTTTEIETIENRLARYRSRMLTDAQRDTLHVDICEAVIAAQPSSASEAVAWMTIATTFLADVAPASGCTLDDCLTDAMISHWVSTSALAGKSRHTLKTRRGVLERILRARRGSTASIVSGPARRASSTHLSADRITALLGACSNDCDSALRGFFGYIGAGVPIGTRGVRFVTDGEARLASTGQTWYVAARVDNLTNLDGHYLLDDDWSALRDVASTLGLTMSKNIAAQTFRFIALNDDAFSLAERLTRYRLSDESVSAIVRQLPPITNEDWETAQPRLRDACAIAECSEVPASALSLRPPERGRGEAHHLVSRKTSRAAAKRLAQQRAAESAARSERSAPVANYLASYVPDQDDQVWESIAETVRTAVARCQFLTIETARKHAVSLTAFLRWRSSSGESIDIATALNYAAIDAFYVHGMPDLSNRSRGDYRSRLRHIAVMTNASILAPPALRLGHNTVNPGYDEREEITLRRVSLKQSNGEVRRRLCAIVGFCAGAGLSSAELRALRRCDVVVGDDGLVIVTIHGPRAHRTVVRRIYERHVLIALEGLRDDQLVLPELKSSSPITAILKGADLLDQAPAIDTRRLRTTWICWLMTQRVPLQVAFEASGLQSARTFYDMLDHLPVIARIDDLRDGGAK